MAIVRPGNICFTVANVLVSYPNIIVAKYPNVASFRVEFIRIAFFYLHQI